MRTLTQNKDFQIDSAKTKIIKNKLKMRKISNYKAKLEKLRNSVNEKMKRWNNSNKTGSSNWLSVIPMREFNCFNFWINRNFRTPADCDIVTLFQISSLVALAERASMWSTPCRARRDDSLPCDMIKWEV